MEPIKEILIMSSDNAEILVAGIKGLADIQGTTVRNIVQQLKNSEIHLERVVGQVVTEIIKSDTDVPIAESAAEDLRCWCVHRAVVGQDRMSIRCIDFDHKIEVTLAYRLLGSLGLIYHHSPDIFSIDSP